MVYQRFNSEEFENLMKIIIKMDPNYVFYNNLWICARKPIIIFKQSQLPYFKKICKDLVYNFKSTNKNSQKTFVIPIVFYPCEDPLKYNNYTEILLYDRMEKEKQVCDEKCFRDSFIIFNHVNVLIIFTDISKCEIHIERYEPSTTIFQDMYFHFNEMLLIEFGKQLEEELKLQDIIDMKIIWHNISSIGSQKILEDNKYCTTHVLYYIFWRIILGSSNLAMHKILNFEKKDFKNFGLAMKECL